MKEGEVIRYPIEDSIDLHTFRPKEVRELLDDYLEAASRKGFTEVRIIHGKGTGGLRRIVHSVLETHPLVISFGEAGPEAGGWGATIAAIRPRGPGKAK
ncbi:MAG: Smr/MutS family protein [Syntrophobacteraceae bacterium]|nr:Smr/MutS family protein [Syntrophobacteraceae bacterium]